MDFATCYNSYPVMLMEGALGERLKREYNLSFDENIAMAGLIYDPVARQALNNLFREYLAIAEKYQLPFMATTPTRRANRERISKAQLSSRVIEDNVRFLQHIQSAASVVMFVGGLMGCQGDAYKATDILAIDQAEEFHSWQADLFKEAGVDFLYAGIMPALTEAIGMAKAMENTQLPYIISFMLRDNGKLLDGTTIHEAICAIDQATKVNPICYMTNCVHPLVLFQALSWPFNKTTLVQERFHGIQANTSWLSPEELDGCDPLQASDSVNLANAMMDLRKVFTPKIFGGCCGTDHTHLEEIAKRLLFIQGAAHPDIHGPVQF